MITKGGLVRRVSCISLASLTLVLAASSSAFAQDPPLRITVPTVIVTAQKEPIDGQKAPVSVTAVTAETLAAAGMTIISDVGMVAPNTYFSEFTARKLSFARFRGISSGPGNPAITTYFDGVPQLHTNASSQELLDVEQVELVRGGQSALFGRNALGGLVNVLSTRPSLSRWGGSVSLPFGNFGARELRGSVSGPLSSTLALGVSAAGSERDGYTVNDITGNTIDNRSTRLGKVQLLWVPVANWEARAIVSTERNRDGDYALSDVGGLRTNPYHVSRNVEGFTNRDVLSTTFSARRTGSRFSFSTTTGIVKWDTEDSTDLDYTPFPILTRNNTEDAFQFTEEVRLASGDSAIQLSDRATLKWQAGAFVFTQGYEQDVVNGVAAGAFDPRLNFPIQLHLPKASMDDAGVGFYGQGTITLSQRLDVILGARVDHERKSAVLDTFFEPQLPGAIHTDVERNFTGVSPHVAVAYRLQPNHLVYGSVGRGYKAGGFNAASPAGRDAFEEEQAWNVETGVKTAWAASRVTANAAFFHINWDDMQLNVPDAAAGPAQFYVANIGKATSTGVEFELNARPVPALDLFSSVGYTRARFGDGSSSQGVPVADNRIPSTPEYTVSAGAQLSRAVTSIVTLFGRAEVVRYGSFFHDDFNFLEQEAYGLANLRAGVRAHRITVEGWVRNVGNTKYIQIALPYDPNFAPSGFIGELGRPRTFGVSAGVTF